MKAEDEDMQNKAGSGNENAGCSDSTAPAAPERVHGAVIGTLLELSDDGTARISYPGYRDNQSLAARSIIHLTKGSVGREVALLFENGHIDRPIVIGVLQDDVSTGQETVYADTEREHADSAESVIIMDDSLSASGSELIVDGRTITLQAREQIVLRCGKSSITMTQAGKVIIRGAYISSKSSGANRIKGGSVQIN